MPIRNSLFLSAVFPRLKPKERFRVFTGSTSGDLPLDYRTIFNWYDVKLDSIASDSSVMPIPRTHRFSSLPHPDSLMLPVAMDPGFDVRRTVDLARMIQRWGVVPLQFVDGFRRGSHTYAFLGTEDFTMYPC